MAKASATKRFWGKADRKDPARVHLLEHHLADVGACFEALLAQPRDAQQITFTHFARAEEVLEVEEQRLVDGLAPHYIWTTGYAQSRLRWKPMLPLSVMLLRAYRLEAPVTVPWLPEYSGCTSWVELLTDVSLGRMEPVLSGPEFQAQVDTIKGCLGLAVAAG